ncbi:MAG TPA: alpha/beta hydrolase [Actinomycetota bacterium]|nr:alpha/beta hydrolase [Actinomycetota bacterium]
MQEGRVVGADGVWLATRTWSGRADGPAFVLHHGLASSQHIWDLMVPGLARTGTVVTFDARGHGESGKPSSGYGFDHTVADAVAVLKAARRRKPVLVGHSWGAMVALEVAAQRPASVSGVVLIDGGVGSMRDGFASWAEAREALAPPHLAGTPADEFRAMIPRFFGDAVDVTPEIVDIVMSVMRVDPHGRISPRLTRANHMRILRAIWQQDPVAMHARLRVPALAILAASDGDPGWDARKHEGVEALRTAGAATKVTSMQGIHDLPLQHPRELVTRIRAFARTAVR